MVSVIVPCYNAERVMPKCVESLLKQSYRDIEIVLVNDGSIDDRTALVPLFLSGMIHINCNKLLHSEIIRRQKLRYPDFPVNEDYVFMLSYLEHCRSIKSVSSPLYHWIRVDGKETALSAFSVDYISIYNSAHLLTIRYFTGRHIAGQIMFYSYYWQILKYVRLIRQGKASIHNMYRLMENELLQESLNFHHPSTIGEKGMLFLLKHRLYGLFYLLNKLSHDG